MTVMRYFLALYLFLLPLCLWFCTSCTTQTPTPKTVEAAEEQAKIAIIKAETEKHKQELNQELEDKKHGHFWIKVGIALFVAGGFAFVILKNMGLEMIGLASSIGGVGCISYGSIVVKISGHETVIAAGSVIVILISFAAYFCHGKGISIRKSIRQFWNSQT